MSTPTSTSKTTTFKSSAFEKVYLFSGLYTFVKILYWSPSGEFIYPENFRSLTDHIFQFNFQLWLSGLLNCTIDADRHKSFKSHTFNACKWPRWAKNKTLQNSSLKINRLNQLIMKLACPMQHRGKYQLKILIKALKLKV